MTTHRLTRDDSIETESEVITDRVAVTARLGQVLILVAGAILVLSGTITLAKTGIHHNLATPVVTVWGHAHSPWLGIAELVVGLLLVSTGASWARREGAVVLGVLLAVAGLIVQVRPSNAPSQMAIDHGYGRLPLILGLVAVVGGLLPGGITRSRRRRLVDPG